MYSHVDLYAVSDNRDDRRPTDCGGTTMRLRFIASVFLVLAMAGMTACANTDTDSPSTDDELASSGVALTSDILADTDVARMRFRIEGVACTTGTPTGFSTTEVKDLEDMMLPGGIATFENAPFDADSRHLFADAFFLVDAGCYDVTTTPLDDTGDPSDDCEPAHKDGVAVEDGQTTEILLINQCQGVDRGGLDVISAINHPPEVEGLEFNKFISMCATDIQDDEVCVTADDPDDDPLAFEWRATDAGQFQGAIVETSRTELADGRWRSCADLATIRRGDYGFQVRVFDLDGNGERLEQVLADQGNPAPSRDALRFPVYAGVDCPNVGDITHPVTLRQLAEVKIATRQYLDHARALEDFARFTFPIPNRGVNHIRRSLITDQGTLDFDRPFEAGSAEHRAHPDFLWYTEPAPGDEQLVSVEYAVPTTREPPLDLFAGQADDDEWHIHPSVEELIPPAQPQFRSIAGACHYESGGEFYLAVTADGARELIVPPTGEIVPGGWSNVEPSACPPTGPFGSDFRLVHAPLWVLNVWLYRDNPEGLFHGPNPTLMVAPPSP